MTITIPAGFVQATFNFSSPYFDSGKGATVIGYTRNGDLSLMAQASGLRDAFETNILNIMTNQIRLLDVTVVDATDGAISPSTLSGGASFSSCPPNTALLVRKEASGRGRANRGRIYAPGLLSDGNIANDGTIDPTAVTALQGAWSDFFVAVETDSEMTPVILHNDPALEPTPVLSFLVQPKPATQRRRLRK